MLQRLWRLLFPVHTGQVQSWREFLTELERRGYRESDELRARRMIALRRQRAADAVRAKFGGEA